MRKLLSMRAHRQQGATCPWFLSNCLGQTMSKAEVQLSAGCWNSVPLIANTNPLLGSHSNLVHDEGRCRILAVVLRICTSRWWAQLPSAREWCGCACEPVTESILGESRCEASTSSGQPITVTHEDAWFRHGTLRLRAAVAISLATPPG